MQIQNTTYNKCELSIRLITFIHYATVYINPKLTRSNGLTIAYERGNKWHYVVQPYSHTAFVDLWRSQLITCKTLLTGISYFHHITVIRILARIWTTCGEGRTVWLGTVCHGGGVVDDYSRTVMYCSRKDNRNYRGWPLSNIYTRFILLSLTMRPYNYMVYVTRDLLTAIFYVKM